MPCALSDLRLIRHWTAGFWLEPQASSLAESFAEMVGCHARLVGAWGLLVEPTGDAATTPSQRPGSAPEPSASDLSSRAITAGWALIGLLDLASGPRLRPVAPSCAMSVESHHGLRRPPLRTSLHSHLASALLRVYHLETCPTRVTAPDHAPELWSSCCCRLSSCNSLPICLI